MINMMSDQKIYLDYAATTPVDPRVMDAMLPYFRDDFGNPSSVHTFGQRAEAALEGSRENVARVLDCYANEIVFTSCGSESDNLAIRGTALAARKIRQANHILISPIEHHAVSITAQQLADLHNFEVEFLPVDSYGMVYPETVAERIRPETALVSVMYANNEIGTINPISEIGEICRSAGIPFHTDAVQAAAYLPIDVSSLNVDLLSIGAHKFYGPKGVGALYIRTGTPIFPVQTGGSQEFGLRAGTHNIPYIVGLSAALELTQKERDQRIKKLLPLRDRLIGQILEETPASQLSGHPISRLPNHASFVFHEVDGNLLLTLLDVAGFACSSGSACKTGNPEPSDVLLALGFARDWALGSLRITLGQATSPKEIDLFLDVFPGLIARAMNVYIS
jgi:cysteine desulfurase